MALELKLGVILGCDFSREPSLGPRSSNHIHTWIGHVLNEPLAVGHVLWTSERV